MKKKQMMKINNKSKIPDASRIFATLFCENLFCLGIDFPIKAIYNTTILNEARKLAPVWLEIAKELF